MSARKLCWSRSPHTVTLAMARQRRTPGAAVLHEEAAFHLARGAHRAALAPLCRLVLMLPPRHSALAGLWTTLGHVYLALGRPEHAARAAQAALRAGSRSALTRGVMARATALLSAGAGTATR